MNRNLNILYKSKSLSGILFFLMFGTFIFSQNYPEEFDFNISIYQSFYFFQESDIDGTNLEPGEDWIASFTTYDETNSGECSFIGQDLDGDISTNDIQQFRQ